MEFGFGLPGRGANARPEAIKALVDAGESAGFSHFSIPDHVVMPRTNDSTYPYSQSGRFPGDGRGDWLEQLTYLAYLAGITAKARLITSVMVVPHRQPVLAAKMLATADVLSGGRIVVGCGAGWLAEEFAAIQAPPFEERGRVTNEYLEIFKTLWTDAAPEYAGRYASFKDIHFEPKPVQKPHPPLWIGGESPAALRRAATYGDAWYPIGANPRFPLNTIERYRDGVARLEAACEKAGRPRDAVKLSFWANWYREDEQRRTDTGERHILSGSAQEVADDARRLRDAGVSVLLFNFERGSLDDSLAAVGRFVDEVMPLAAA